MPPSYYWIRVGEEWLKCKKDTFDSYDGIKYFGPSAWSYEYGVVGIHEYPNPCANCPNNTVNGGSGICNCTLGIPKITC